jgi:hypothetical protein|tara:strand:+ start:527 stop:793 length:267 start_codon:yes stop_codon:yes gene_type:complete
MRKQLAALYDHVDDLLHEEKFAEIDQFILDYPIETSNLTMCVGLLTICGAAYNGYSKLAQIDNARQRVRARVTELDPERVEALMKGFE